jgi:DNA repair protein RecO (recombination protein O)
MLTKSRAIVLHHIKYGESSLVVTLYTEKHGRLSCIVNGVRSKKSRFPVTYFQPLTLIEAELYYKPNRELHRIKDVACPYHYVSIPFVIVKSAMALFMAEILMLTLREEEGNADMFGFLFHVFQLLDAREEGISDFHVKFLLHYARYLGFSLTNISSAADIARSPDLQVFRDLPDEAVRAAEEMISNPMSRPDGVKLTYANRILLLDRILRYYREHIDGMNNIKSLPVLQDIFRE